MAADRQTSATSARIARSRMCSSTAAFWPRTVSRPGLSFFRERDERYADIIRVAADAFGEDDCESIGGTSEMTGPSPALFGHRSS